MKTKNNIKPSVFLFSIFFILINLPIAYAQNSVKDDSTQDIVYVSILPQKFFVEYLANNFLNVHVLVKAGQTPETYEPTSKQMVNLAKSKLYFTLGLNFEQKILNRIIANNRQLQIIETHKNIKRIESDPHIWLDPILVLQQLDEIYNALKTTYPNHRQRLRQRYTELQQRIKQIHNQLDKTFSSKNTQDKTAFVIFHPALSYFSRRYGLKQIAIEKEGKSNSAKYMAELMSYLKSQSVKIILVEKQFSQKEALTVAKVVNARLLEFDPLAFSWFKNMQHISKQVSLSLF